MQVICFPERLRRLRERKGISRRVLSELCGLPTDAVRRYERGEAYPTLPSLLALAEYFGVDPTLIRLAWVLLCAMGGSGVVAYIVAAIVIPRDPGGSL